MERLNYHFEIKFNRKGQTSFSTIHDNAFATSKEDAEAEVKAKFYAKYKDVDQVAIKCVRQSK